MEAIQKQQASQLIQTCHHFPIKLQTLQNFKKKAKLLFFSLKEERGKMKEISPSNTFQSPAIYQKTQPNSCTK